MSIHLELQVGDVAEPCPFCGSVDIELANTHSAAYWVECASCGAQVHGCAYGTDRTPERMTLRQHRMAKNSALAAWNARADDGVRDRAKDLIDVLVSLKGVGLSREDVGRTNDAITALTKALTRATPPSKAEGGGRGQSERKGG